MLYGPDSTARPTYTTRLQRPISPASSVGFNKARPHYTAASRLSGPITCPLSPVIQIAVDGWNGRDATKASGMSKLQSGWSK
jgi:hypothetical protein